MRQNFTDACNLDDGSYMYSFVQSLDRVQLLHNEPASGM